MGILLLILAMIASTHSLTADIALPSLKPSTSLKHGTKGFVCYQSIATREGFTFWVYNEKEDLVSGVHYYLYGFFDGEALPHDFLIDSIPDDANNIEVSNGVVFAPDSLELQLIMQNIIKNSRQFIKKKPSKK